MKRTASLILVGLFLWPNACATYTQIGLRDVADHEVVQVTLTDGERETLYNPWIEVDSIKDRWAVYSLEQVAKLEAVGTDEVGTVFTMLGIAVVAVPIAYCVAADPEFMGEPIC